MRFFSLWWTNWLANSPAASVAKKIISLDDSLQRQSLLFTIPNWVFQNNNGEFVSKVSIPEGCWQLSENTLFQVTGVIQRNNSKLKDSGGIQPAHCWPCPFNMVTTVNCQLSPAPSDKLDVGIPEQLAVLKQKNSLGWTTLNPKTYSHKPRNNSVMLSVVYCTLLSHAQYVQTKGPSLTLSQGSRLKISTTFHKLVRAPWPVLPFWFVVFLKQWALCFHYSLSDTINAMNV